MTTSTRLAFLLYVFFLIHSFMYAQSQQNQDCSFLKDCKLELQETGDKSIVIIKGNKHKELIDEKNYIYSDLEWITDCEYKATITEFKWPGFMFDVGEVLHAKVVDIEGDSVYMDIKVQDLEIEVVYLRIE